MLLAAWRGWCRVNPLLPLLRKLAPSARSLNPLHHIRTFEIQIHIIHIITLSNKHTLPFSLHGQHSLINPIPPTWTFINLNILYHPPCNTMYNISLRCVTAPHSLHLLRLYLDSMDTLHPQAPLTVPCRWWQWTTVWPVQTLLLHGTISWHSTSDITRHSHVVLCSRSCLLVISHAVFAILSLQFLE